jgi:3-hydroxyisobutyrate dehydrogenase
MSIPGKTIGFIGIGTMGKPMSLNLIKGGYSLVAYDINPTHLDELKQKGAIIGQSSKEVASQSNVIITMLPKSEDVEKVILGKNGVIEGIKSNSIIIDMSTIDPSVSRRIAQVVLPKNIKMLDAPVSGGQMGAESGTLSIMVGGDEDVYHECLDIFKRMGKNIFYCGSNGNGQVVKTVNNLLGGIQLVATAEALSMGVKAGVDLKLLADVISASSGHNFFIKTVFPVKAFKGDFEPGFTVDLMYKDLGLAMTLAKEQGVPLLMGALTHQIYLYIKSLGLGGKDITIVTKMFEDLMNVKLRF